MRSGPWGAWRACVAQQHQLEVKGVLENGPPHGRRGVLEDEAVERSTRLRDCAQVPRAVQLGQDARQQLVRQIQEMLCSEHLGIECLHTSVVSIR